jgi:hypothetical protein
VEPGSLDQTLPNIGELLQYGQITLSHVRSDAWQLPMTAARLCPWCFAVREKL